MDNEKLITRRTSNSIVDSLNRIAGDLRETAKQMETGSTIITTPRVIKAAERLEEIAEGIGRYDSQRYIQARKTTAYAREKEKIRHRLRKMGMYARLQRDGTYSVYNRETNELLHSGLDVQGLAAMTEAPQKS